MVVGNDLVGVYAVIVVWDCLGIYLVEKKLCLSYSSVSSQDVARIAQYCTCCKCTCIVSLTAQIRLICSLCMKICLRRAAHISAERLISCKRICKRI